MRFTGSRFRCRPQLVAGALIAAAAGLACGQVTADDIQDWKKTPDGREKLVKVARDARQPVSHRAAAAAALAENGAVDRMESAIAALPFDQRGQVIPATAQLVARGLDRREPGRADDARDALFALRRQSTTDEATRTVDAALLPALEQDLRGGRADGGRHTLKEMMTALGPPALPMVERVLDDTQAPFGPAVEVLLAVGDRPAHEKGGAALVKRARGMATVPADLFAAMAKLGGEAVSTFLQEKVSAADPQTAERAAEALTRLPRNPALLGFAVRVARNGSAPTKVREHMIAVAKSLGGDEARKALLEALAAEPDPAWRFRFFQGVLDAGGGKAVLAALEALPLDASYQPEEVKQKVVAPVAGLGWQAREGTFKAMESRSVVARMLAVLILEKSGLDSDAAAVAKLAKDRGTVKGFPRGQTVGSEASRVASTLKKPTG